jgi:hypothetical protein
MAVNQFCLNWYNSPRLKLLSKVEMKDWIKIKSAVMASDKIEYSAALSAPDYLRLKITIGGAPK